MLRAIIQRLYRSIPGVRELIQIRDILHEPKAVEAIRLIDFELDGHPRYSDP